jgi:hypothetical protein
MTTAGACAMVIDLTKQVALARADTKAWRELAQAAIKHAADRDAELTKERDRHQRLIEEYRSYRARTTVQGAA